MSDKLTTLAIYSCQRCGKRMVQNTQVCDECLQKKRIEDSRTR